MKKLLKNFIKLSTILLAIVCNNLHKTFGIVLYCIAKATEVGHGYGFLCFKIVETRLQYFTHNM